MGIPVPQIWGIGNINYLALFKWIWLFFPLWFVSGYYMDWFIKSKSVTILRYGSYKSWFITLILDLHILLLFYAVGLFIMYRVLHVNDTLWPMILIIVHVYIIMFVLLVIRCISKSAVISIAMVLLGEAFMFILGDELKISAAFIPSDWSMYVRSYLHGLDMVFNPYIVVLIQILCSGLLMVFSYIVISRKRFIKRR